MPAPTDSISVPAGTYVLLRRTSCRSIGDTLNGAGARSTIIDGNNTRPRDVGHQLGRTASTINGVTIRGGQSSANLAAASTCPGPSTINNSHIVGNTAPSGGGIFLSGERRVLTMVGSTVAGNTASNSTGASGGGIASDSEGQTITLINSTVTGNVARDVGLNSAQGGGIYAAAVATR